MVLSNNSSDMPLQLHLSQNLQRHLLLWHALDSQQPLFSFSPTLQDFGESQNVWTLFLNTQLLSRVLCVCVRVCVGGITTARTTTSRNKRLMRTSGVTARHVKGLNNVQHLQRRFFLFLSGKFAWREERIAHKHVLKATSLRRYTHSFQSCTSNGPINLEQCRTKQLAFARRAATFVIISLCNSHTHACTH